MSCPVDAAADGAEQVIKITLDIYHLPIRVKTSKCELAYLVGRR